MINLRIICFFFSYFITITKSLLGSINYPSYFLSRGKGSGGAANSYEILLFDMDFLEFFYVAFLETTCTSFGFANVLSFDRDSMI